MHTNKALKPTKTGSTVNHRLSVAPMLEGCDSVDIFVDFQWLDMHVALVKG